MSYYYSRKEMALMIVLSLLAVVVLAVVLFGRF